MLEWAAIVGERSAALCEPARLQWPPRGPKSEPQAGVPATLWLRVTPGRALDVQYGAPALIERINAFFGWRMVARVAVAPQPKRPAQAPVQPAQADPEMVARATSAAARADHEDLRNALTRLGTEVFRERAR